MYSPFLCPLFHTFSTFFGYDLSYLEAIGTFTGLLAVWYAAKNKIINWPLGLVNVSCFAVLFYANQLYADVFLQIYFFGMGIYGWYFWRAQQINPQPIRSMKTNKFLQLITYCLLASLVCGYGVTHLHEYFPSTFPQPAAYPFADSFVTVFSIVANVLMARYVLQNWLFWIVVDIIAPIIYYQRGILFVSMEFVLFLVIAMFGYFQWHRQLAFLSVK